MAIVSHRDFKKLSIDFKKRICYLLDNIFNYMMLNRKEAPNFDTRKILKTLNALDFSEDKKEEFDLYYALLAHFYLVVPYQKQYIITDQVKFNGILRYL